MSDQEKNAGAAEQLDNAVRNFVNGLEGQATKLSVADVLRLLDLRKELAHDEIREVRVKWVESNPAASVIKT